MDIRTKADIYALLRAFAQEGKGVLIFCTEVSEVFEVADRALVVDNGYLSPPLDVQSYARDRGARGGYHPPGESLARVRRARAAPGDRRDEGRRVGGKPCPICGAGMS